MKRFLIPALLLFWGSTARLSAENKPKFSTAGFFEMEESGRNAYSMNQAWRFIKSDVTGNAAAPSFDDSAWEVVSIPHGLELLPVEASGSGNYQGVAWYRKHFTPAEELQGKELFLHFEAIMGKGEVYLNGELIKEFFGGYLPVISDITDRIRWGEENVIAVKADNSDDPNYPVGKPQTSLDFSYFGGIYRDCWLIAHNDVFITNANYEQEVAGGGLFVHFDKVSEERAEVNFRAHIRNSSARGKRVTALFALKDAEGRVVESTSKSIYLPKSKAGYAVSKVMVENPHLWSPNSPYLYDLEVTLSAGGEVIDGYRQRVGIRSIEFKQEEGLWINGKEYPTKLIGTNRHQDFAVIGNAVPNSLQWRDAKKLREAGMQVIRTHYVIDPAFMDACDELGLFALVETPGWQFWNKEPHFAKRVYSDIQNMVRLHRNHASLFFWEPVLNETHYPNYFAKRTEEICREEYPYKYSVAACDDGAEGDEYFPLLLRPTRNLRPDKTYFIREWGDNVDDWNAHNSDSRVSREWGETPMLIQADHYAHPQYGSARYESAGKTSTVLCLETIFKERKQVVGACFWHSFDHNRGYHTDPFYGGMMDSYRQPKYSYYMFMSQRPTEVLDTKAESGPMVYIANELTPFSPRDITVYSNCDEVRLTLFGDERNQWTLKKELNREGMPSPIWVFEDKFHFMDWKNMARAKRHEEAYLLAEGIVDGKVVTSHKRYPAGQAYKINLRLDNEGVALQADGSDVVTVIAEMVDKRGTVKRLNNMEVTFQIEGEGRLLANSQTATNPVKIEWGSAPVLVQSTTTAGKITVIARLTHEGKNRPMEGVLEFESVASDNRQIVDEAELALITTEQSTQLQQKNTMMSEAERAAVMKRREAIDKQKLEVESQQTHFGKGIND